MSSREVRHFDSAWGDSIHLVIDDLFRGKGTDTSIASLVALVAERLDRDQKTVITCDKRLEAVRETDPRSLRASARFGRFEFPARIAVKASQCAT